MKKESTLEKLKKELKLIQESFDIAQTLPLKKNSSKKLKYIVFSIKNEKYAWPLLYLKEIIINQNIIPIPGEINTYNGVFNYKNRVVPVINMKYYLDILIPEIKSINILMVTNKLPVEISIPVENLISIISIEKDNIKPNTLKSKNASLIKGEILFNNEIISILNPESFF